jgi:hypothetical protein
MAFRGNRERIGFTHRLRSAVNASRSLLTRLENLPVLPTRQLRVSYVRFMSCPRGRRRAGVSQRSYGSSIPCESDTRFSGGPLEQRGRSAIRVGSSLNM